jgi:hypothetical protein
MGKIEMFSMTKEELEDDYDKVKTVVLSCLVHDKIITKEKADAWARVHAPILRRKNIFRTLSDLWSKTDEKADTWKILIVEIPGPQ